MTKTLLDHLLTRSSPPIDLLGGEAPSDAEIETMIRIAARVPDHGKLTPWRFILYRGEIRGEIGEKLAALAERLEGPLDEARRRKELTRFSRAPLVIAVVHIPQNSEKIPEWETFLSGGAAAMNLLHAASALGYQANWISNWYADEPEGRAILGFAPNERVIGFVHIGRYDKPVPDRPRPEPGAIMSDYAGPDAS